METPWVAPHGPGAHIDVEVLIDGRPDTRSYSLVGEGGGAVWRIARRGPAVRLAQRLRHGQAVRPEARHILTLAQDQHRCVREAIANREGSRAEAIMREHARLTRRNLELALATSTPCTRRAALIERRQTASKASPIRAAARATCGRCRSARGRSAIKVQTPRSG